MRMALLDCATGSCSPRFFFFQAEDGIRVLYVTGVQTCALPISYRRSSGLVYGNGTFIRSNTAVWSLTDLKQRTFALAPMPRGSTPTMSKRSSSESLRKYGA